MIGDCVLHSLGDEIDPLLNLRELLGGSYVPAFFVFFRWITCVNGDVGRPVRNALALDGPDAARRFALRKPLVETGGGGRLTLRKRGLRLLRPLPHQVQSEALFAQQLSAEGFL